MNRILNTVTQALYDKKATNIIAINVEGVSTLTDFIIIAEGTVDRHVKALSSTVMDKLAEEKIYPLLTEGIQEGDWIVLDYGNFVVHLFTPELRDRYALESIWKNGKIVDFIIDTDKKI